MRERHIFWDIATVGLLFIATVIVSVVLIQNERGWEYLKQQNENSKQIISQNREILNRLESGIKFQGVQIAQGSGAHADNHNTNGATQAPEAANGRKIYDGSDLPHWVRGDEKADDGDFLVLNERSEPNSLNPLIDNDATASTLFGRANDTLVERAWDDYSYWQPKLARAWEKGMIIRAIAAKKNAPELASKLEKAWDAEAKKRLKIAAISAESDEILHIELTDASGDYKDEALKILSESDLEKQYWIYVTFEGSSFTDGTKIDGESVAARLEAAVKATSGFKGRFQMPWVREGSVVIQVIGDGELARKTIKEYVDSPANKGEVVDPKSATGKRMDKVLTMDLMEPFVFEEKPVFTFYLRNDVKWHDGAPFTGKDIVFTFNTIMNLKIEAAPTRNYLQDCESVKLVNNDPYTVQFTWKKPYFLAFNTSAEFSALPEHIFKFDDPEKFNHGQQNQTLIGNGAYRLERWERKKQFLFVRNEDYYGPKPHFKKIVYKLVDDPTVGLALLEKGDLDVQGLSKSQAKVKFEDKQFADRFKIDVSVANVYRYIGWNARLPLFSSAKVRRALTMLIDRKRIIEDVYRGFALPLNGPAHPDAPTYSPKIEKYAVPYDPQEAVRLLNEEGWKDTNGDGILDKDGKNFEFTLLIVNNSPEYESMANLIKNSLAKAGIVMNISNLEWSLLLQKTERLQFDAVVLGWRLGIDDDPYQLWHSSQTGEKASNHCNFVNKEADRLIEDGRRELNDAKRNKMFQRVYEIIAQEQPYTFLLVEKRTVATDKRIENVKYKLTGPDFDRWWVPKAKQKYQ